LVGISSKLGCNGESQIGLIVHHLFVLRVLPPLIESEVLRRRGLLIMAAGRAVTPHATEYPYTRIIGTKDFGVLFRTLQRNV